jgi:DNA-directed RNA polymerase II subunit RPB1
MWIPEYSAGGQIVTLPTPAILKPKALWSGKQLFSMIIPRINLARLKTKDKTICHKGELLEGVLTKQILGPTGNSIAHIVSKEYGPHQAANFLSAVQQLVNNWLVFNGFTVGVQDIIVDEKHVSDNIRDTLVKFKQQVRGILSKSHEGKLVSQPGMDMLQSFEADVNKTLNDARDKSGNIALDGLNASNRLRNMVTAGSKGSNINIS